MQKSFSIKHLQMFTDRCTSARFTILLYLTWLVSIQFSRASRTDTITMTVPMHVLFFMNFEQFMQINQQATIVVKRCQVYDVVFNICSNVKKLHFNTVQTFLAYIISITIRGYISRIQSQGRSRISSTLVKFYDVTYDVKHNET